MIGDLITKANNGALALPTKLATNKGTGVTTADLEAATGWPLDATDGPVHFAMFKVDPTDQTKILAGSLTFWKATLTGVTLSNMQLTGGNNQSYSIGDSVLITSTPGFINDLVTALLTQHNRDGSHKNITSTNATITNLTVTNLTVGGQTPSPDWTALGATPSSVTPYGNRSYGLVFPGDYSGTINPATRLRFTRSVVAPVLSAFLNGTNQYFNRTATINGMTVVDDFVSGAWVKLSSYPGSNVSIISRFNGTSGWNLNINPSGQVYLQGYNAGSGNWSLVQSYQSIPLNRWVHIAAQLDMSAFTATTTTSYIMLDGVDVPAFVSRAGTNPTALVQAGNLEVGTANGSGFFPGKIVQAFVSSAKITQANIQNIMTRSLTAGDMATYSIVSAFSLANSTTDINTTNANNLTPQNSAVTTNTDSPFGQQANGSISTTLDYGIVQSVSYSGGNTTVVAQLPEGNTIPASGGVSAVSYASAKAPFGMSVDRNRWQISSIFYTGLNLSIPLNTFSQTLARITSPIGKYIATTSVPFSFDSNVTGTRSGFVVFSPTLPPPISGSTVAAGYYGFRSVVFNSLNLFSTACISRPIDVSVATTFSIYAAIDVATGAEFFVLRGEQGGVHLTLEPANL